MDDLLRLLGPLITPLITSTLTLGGGWLLLRKMERVRREEEFFANMRKVQTEAVVKVLEALGRFHNIADRALQWESADPLNVDLRRQLPPIREEQEKRLKELLDLAAANQFLLGEFGNHVSSCLAGIAGASSPQQAADAANSLHAELECWIPPLRKLR